MDLISIENEVRKRRKAALAAVTAVTAATEAYAGLYLDKKPYNDSALSGREWLREVHSSRSPHKMRMALGLHKQVFDIVLDVLMEHGGLEDTGRVNAEEHLAIFLYLCRNGVGVRAVGDRFQRATDTVSRHV